MSRPRHVGVKLPKQLLDRLDVPTSTRKNVSGRFRSIRDRKIQRKETRNGQKGRGANGKKWHGHGDRSHDAISTVGKKAKVDEDSDAASDEGTQTDSNDESVSKSDTEVEEAARSIPSTAKRKLHQDDEEIKALERALGIKSKKSSSKAPKSDDDFGDLLDGLDELDDEDNAANTANSTKPSTADDEWLTRKRQKAQRSLQGSTTQKARNAATIESDVDDSELFSDESAPGEKFRPPRENPFVPPQVQSMGIAPGAAYIPPSKRLAAQSVGQDHSQLRRQLKGLINRLSESNIQTIVLDIEKLYRSHARQDVSECLIKLLVSLLSDHAVLQDTFIILHTGFITALSRLRGSEFAAQLLATLDQEIQGLCSDRIEGNKKESKSISNMLAAVAYLYRLRIVSNVLVYDYVRYLLNDISESNAEILLKILRIAGQQLRQDDSGSLKAITMQLHTKIAEMNPASLSTRTKFMVETIDNLSNGRSKTGIVASTLAADHLQQMKKTLGQMSQKNMGSFEPLNFGLDDIRNSKHKGRWWLVGASYNDNTLAKPQTEPETLDSTLVKFPLPESEGMPVDLAQLASQQRMNTEVRRSIFVAIMSATDIEDAFARLKKLRLKKTQEYEIPKVILQCAGSEITFNPFYTYLCRRLCGDRKIKMAFQFSLWDSFKRMGESNAVDESDSEDETSSNHLTLRSVINLARLYGSLVAESTLSISILKNLNIAYLQPLTKVFVELFFVTLILQSQSQGKNLKREPASLLRLFVDVKNIPQMDTSVQYFLKTTVRNTDITTSANEQGLVKWGVDLICDELTAMRHRIDTV